MLHYLKAAAGIALCRGSNSPPKCSLQPGQAVRWLGTAPRQGTNRDHLQVTAGLAAGSTRDGAQAHFLADHLSCKAGAAGLELLLPSGSLVLTQNRRICSRNSPLPWVLNGAWLENFHFLGLCASTQRGFQRGVGTSPVFFLKCQPASAVLQERKSWKSFSFLWEQPYTGRKPQNHGMS